MVTTGRESDGDAALRALITLAGHRRLLGELRESVEGIVGRRVDPLPALLGILTAAMKVREGGETFLDHPPSAEFIENILAHEPLLSPHQILLCIILRPGLDHRAAADLLGLRVDELHAGIEEVIGALSHLLRTNRSASPE